MYFSLFSVHMAFLCSSMILLTAACWRDWIVENCGSRGLLALYFLAALRMFFPFTPYFACKLPMGGPLNLLQTLADIPFIISHRRIRLSTLFLALWAGVSLLLLLGYLIFRLVKARFPKNRAPSRRWSLFLWDVACICFWWNPVLWLSRKGLALAVTGRGPQRGRKFRAALLFSACAVLILASYTSVFLSHFQPGTIDYLSYESAARQTFIEPLPYGGYALHDHGYSALLSSEEKERLERQGLPVIWAK